MLVKEYGDNLWDACTACGVYGIPYVSVSSQRWTGSLSWLAAVNEWQRGGITATEGFKVIGQMTGQDDNTSLPASWHTDTHIVHTLRHKHLSHLFTSSRIRTNFCSCWEHGGGSMQLNQGWDLPQTVCSSPFRLKRLNFCLVDAVCTSETSYMLETWFVSLVYQNVCFFNTGL